MVVLVLAGLLITLYGLYAFAKGIFLLLKGAYYRWYAPEKSVNKKLHSIVQNKVEELESYDEFEKELEGLIK